MTNSIYTTEQASEILVVLPGTIRQWKSRKAAQLIEGTHWVNQDGVTYWTEAGLGVLRRFKDKKTVTGRVTPTVTDGTTGNVTTSVTGDYFEPLLEALADGITPNLISRLTAKVNQRLGNAIARPMSQATINQQCLEVLAAVGITPGPDPVTLLTGGTSLYLEGGDDEED